MLFLSIPLVVSGAKHHKYERYDVSNIQLATKPDDAPAVVQQQLICGETNTTDDKR